MPTDNQSGIILPTKAHLRASRELSTAERATLTDKVKARALTWEDEGDPIFFDVFASSNEVDSYGTYMKSSTLRNFAEDADAGVSVLDSHRHDKLGFGQSVTGRYIAEGETEQLESTFFTIPDLEIEGRNTNSYIRGMRRGLWRDISVGFWMPPDAVIRCSICGKDMMRWYSDDGCWHFPGNTYDVEGDGQTHREVAYGGIENARLSEYSLVYDGATPGAGVAKARQMEDAGKLDARTAGVLEQIYPNVRFPGATGRRYAGFTPAGERTMPDGDMAERTIAAALNGTRSGDETNPDDDGQTPNTVPTDEGQVPAADDVAAAATTIEDPTDEPAASAAGAEGGDADGDGDADERARTRQSIPVTVRNSINARYAEHKIVIGENVGEALETLAAEIVRVRGQRDQLRKDNAAMTRDAEDGKTYRKHLTDDMVTEAVRAMNLDTAKAPDAGERYRKMVENADLDQIRAMRDDFAGIARAKYSNRVSRDNPLDGETQRGVDDDALSDEAYYANA